MDNCTYWNNTNTHTTENQVKHVWVNIRLFRTKPGTLWSLGRVSMWRVKVGSKKPSWVQVQAWATLTLSPGSPLVPGGPVGPAGPVSPCEGNIQNTQKTEHPNGKPYFFQQKLPATLSLYVSALLFSTEIMLVFFQGCIFRCLLLKKSVSFSENHTQLPPDG